jgi:hypothetical protein
MEDEGLKDWIDSPSRNRIRALSEVMHDIVKAAKNQGFNFAEIMTAMDAFQIELAVKHNISPADFEKAMVNVCNHYDRIYKRHQDENRTD